MLATESNTKADTKLGTSTLPLLADPAGYDPSTFQYQETSGEGMPALKDWIHVFRKAMPGFVKFCMQCDDVPEGRREAAAQAFSTRYIAILDELERHPGADLPEFGVQQPITCLRLCILRDACQRGAGFIDPYKKVKTSENEAALALMPKVLAELDTVADATERMDLALRGVFSGNIFDLGATQSAELFEAGGLSFMATREKLLPRPWAVDDLDRALERFSGPAHKKAVIFLDNAGCDALLGVLPFARELLKRGTTVVLAANAVPNINDITAEELSAILPRVAAFDETFAAATASDRCRVVNSGSDLCVIDLRRLSDEIVEECRDADLIVLEGMGRAIETNLNTKFTCDALKLGMIKHPEVAACLGGRLYDCVIKFDAAPGPS